MKDVKISSFIANSHISIPIAAEVTRDQNSQQQSTIQIQPGEKVYVLKTPRGCYLRTPDKKYVALRSHSLEESIMQAQPLQVHQIQHQSQTQPQTPQPQTQISQLQQQQQPQQQSSQTPSTYQYQEQPTIMPYMSSQEQNNQDLMGYFYGQPGYTNNMMMDNSNQTNTTTSTTDMSQMLTTPSLLSDNCQHQQNNQII